MEKEKKNDCSRCGHDQLIASLTCPGRGDFLSMALCGLQARIYVQPHLLMMDFLGIACVHMRLTEQ
jgi:transcription elongation factor Elf1